MGSPAGSIQDQETGRYIEGHDTSWHDAFIAFFEEYPYVGKACKQIGISRSTFHYHYTGDVEGFQSRVEEAKLDAVENLRYVAHVKALSTSPFLLFKLLCVYDPKFRRAVSTRTVENNITFKFTSDDLMRLPPHILQMIIDNKMNEAQLQQALSEEKYKHLLPAASQTEEDASEVQVMQPAVDPQTVDLKQTAEEGIFEMDSHTLLDNEG